MKLLIKGDRGTGKSCLFQRLQGGPFVEEYIPTQEIQVANIQWHYKSTRAPLLPCTIIDRILDSEDVIKVEIWDVVDKGRPAKQASSGGLKIDHAGPAPPVESALHAYGVLLC